MPRRVPRAAAAVLAALALAALAGLAAAAEKGGPALPRDYRSWRHVRSVAVTDPEHAMYGFHDGYANEAAARGLRSRAVPARYEDGATFVVSIFEIETRRGITGAGAKRRDVVQVKDRAATATGGWRFAAFDAAGKAIAVDAAACVSCHAAAPERDFVLTSFRE
jgi:type IV pilus biogenesis protein CpaD/CtpE